MNGRRRILLTILLTAALVMALAASSLADAGNFSGDSDWGGSDWGGDSSWDSGSDWDSGSSWNDSDWGAASGAAGGYIAGSELSGGSGGSGCTGGDLVGLIVVAILVVIVLRFLRSRKQTGGAQVYQAAEEDAGLPLEQLKAKDPNFNEQALLEKVGNEYIQMQNAWTKKDWEPMRAIMTDALYNQMLRQLEEMKRAVQTNYIERIAVLDARIVRYAQEGDNDVLVIRLQTRICDYTVDDKIGELVRGDKSRELFMTYDWKLIRQKDRQTLAQASMTEVSCPNCGAPLSINQSGKCPYCDAVITLTDHDWALSVIKGISQRTAS